MPVLKISDFLPEMKGHTDGLINRKPIFGFRDYVFDIRKSKWHI